METLTFSKNYFWQASFPGGGWVLKHVFTIVLTPISIAVNFDIYSSCLLKFRFFCSFLCSFFVGYLLLFLLIIFLSSACHALLMFVSPIWGDVSNQHIILYGLLQTNMVQEWFRVSISISLLDRHCHSKKRPLGRMGSGCRVWINDLCSMVFVMLVWNWTSVHDWFAVHCRCSNSGFPKGASSTSLAYPPCAIILALLQYCIIPFTESMRVQFVSVRTFW